MPVRASGRWGGMSTMVLTVVKINSSSVLMPRIIDLNLHLATIFQRSEAS